ncbi:MAG: hypothetical protein ACM3Q1_17820 [Bacteroidales bacterium]
MNLIRFVVVAALPLALSACGVPDLVAHGVKSYERSQENNRGTAANNPPPAQQPAPAAYQPAPAKAEAEYVPAPAPARETITSEPLR